MTINEMREKRELLYAKSMEIIGRIDAENREPTQEERDELTPMRREIEDLGARVAAADRRAAEDRETMAAIRGMGASIERVRGDRESRAAVRGTSRAPRSLSEQFLESAQYRAFMAQFPSGRIPDSVKGIQMMPVPFATLITGDSSTSGGALVVSDRTDTIVEAVRPTLTMLDLVTVGTTGSDTVEYVRVTSETNNAAVVPEATTAAAVGGEVTTTLAGVKPESAMALAVVQEPVKTIAHWIPVTKRALSDAGQLRTMIDSFLVYGVRNKLNSQMVAGAGGSDFTGIANTANIQSQAWDTDQLVTMRRARTLVRVVGGSTPNAYLLNPYDWEDIELLRDAEDRFYFGGPMALGSKTVWGLPVAEDEAVVEGTGYCADFSQCVLWMREQASIAISDSHSDFFIRNLVAILAEERAAFGVLRPGAIVEMDMAAGS